jgi:hypothetical protein
MAGQGLPVSTLNVVGFGSPATACQVVMMSLSAASVLRDVSER